MKTKKRIVQSTYEDTFGMIILLFTISVVPLLVRVTKINYPTEHITWIKDNYIVLDVYSYIKASTLIIIGVMSAAILIYKIFKEKSSFFHSPVIVLSIISMITIIISTLTSNYKFTSIFGFLERYEGALVLLSYLVIFVLAYKTKWNNKALNYFFLFFFISNMILSIIGILQYFGHNPIAWSFIKPLITSFELKTNDFDIDSTVNYRVIGQTLYNYNYVSFFATLSFPIFLTKALYEKNMKIKVASIVLSLLILFNLFGSSARGGMVGIGVGLLLWTILNWKLLFSNLKWTLLFIVLIIVSFVGFEIISDGFVTKRFASIFTNNSEVVQIKKVYTDEDNVVIALANNKLRLSVSYAPDNSWAITSFFDDKEIESRNDGKGNYIYDHEELKLISFHFEQDDEGKVILMLVTDKIRWPFIVYDNTLYLKNIYGKDVVLKESTSLGFEGREKMGSARGYIWSRTLPLIIKQPFFGYGPDTFAFIFPQEDYIGKYYSYGTQNMIVDKVHNVYLQYTINSGIFSLISYLSLIIMFLISGLKVYFKANLRFENYLIPAILVAIASYSVAALFNDSSVHVAPVYWILLGMGLSIVRDQIQLDKK